MSVEKIESKDHGALLLPPPETEAETDTDTATRAIVRDPLQGEDIAMRARGVMYRRVVPGGSDGRKRNGRMTVRMVM